MHWRDSLTISSRTYPTSHLDRLKKAKVDRIVAGDDRVDLWGALERLNPFYGVETV